jgi:hypothetical protein
MFDVDSEYNNSVYNTKNTNNNTNKEIKTNYDSNKEQLKQLLQLYKNYLKIIRLNIGGKYNFVKLYSFNCSSITRKEKGKGYLGHPSTFGSMVRFIPMFDPQVKRMFCINVSHAISPRLCYLISEWIKSGKLLLSSGLDYYKYDTLTVNKILRKMKIDELDNIRSLFDHRIPAGLFGFYKNQNIKKVDDRYNKFFLFMNKLIELYNNNIKIKLDDDFETKTSVFLYGIDEILLGYLFNYFRYNKDLLDHWSKRNVNINKRNDIKSRISNSELKKKDNLEHVFFYNSINPQVFTKSFYHVFHDYYKISKKENEPLKNKLKEMVGEFKDKIRIGYNSDNTIPIQIKYNPNLTSPELSAIKIKIDELINYILIKFKEDNTIPIGISDYQQKNIINFLKLYLKKMYCDDEGQQCRTMYKDPTFMMQLKELDLYQRDLLFYISNQQTQLSLLPRYNSRKFMESIDQDQSIKKTLGQSSIDITGLNILLDSYDEEKPLIIFSKNDTQYSYDFIKNFPEYFTFMNSDHPQLLCELLKYYRDHTKVLPIPYEMLPEVQVGGKRKIRTIKKSKQSKSIKRKITKTKIRK